MSTRSAIIHKTENGYAGIYCHSDGYPSWNGRLLLENYQDPEKVAALIALGDISSLGERVNPLGEHSFENRESGTTVAYGRDRGESDVDTTIGTSVEDVADKIGHNGYVYVFNRGWTCNGKKLTQKLIEKD